MTDQWYTDEGDIVVGRNALRQQPVSQQTVVGKPATNTQQQQVYTPQAPAPQTHAAPTPTQAAAASPTAAPPAGVVIIQDGQNFGGFNELPPGTGTIVFASNDPNLANDVAKAKQQGYKVGIMVSNGSSEDPTVYGQRLADVQNTYHPDILVPDLETYGPNHVDSAYNQQAVAAYQASAQGAPPQLAVTFMSGQANDFDYGAWNPLGAEYWPFTFGADGTAQGAADPAGLEAAVRAASGGAKVAAMIAPGQSPTDASSWILYQPPPNYMGGGGNGPWAGHTPEGQPYTPGGDVYPGTHPEAYPPGQNPPPGQNAPGQTPPGGLTDWAQVYFGQLGLPADVSGQIEQIFQTHASDPGLANALAEGFLETTPWFATNFPGYQWGLRAGLYSDKAGYRDYVNQVNQLTDQYFGRPVTGAEVQGYLAQGQDPSKVNALFKGLAYQQGNYQDVNYLMGAAGGGQMSGDDWEALRNDKAGLTNPLGELLAQRLQKAVQQVSGLFGGSMASPSLTLGSQGLNSPSLSGQGGVDQRGSADLSA